MGNMKKKQKCVQFENIQKSPDIPDNGGPDWGGSLGKKGKHLKVIIKVMHQILTKSHQCCRLKIPTKMQHRQTHITQNHISRYCHMHSKTRLD